MRNLNVGDKLPPAWVIAMVLIVADLIVQFFISHISMVAFLRQDYFVAANINSVFVLLLKLKKLKQLAARNESLGDAMGACIP